MRFYLILGMIVFVMVTLGTIYLDTHERLVYTHYHTGTCLRDHNAEWWESTYRIEAVGGHSYLIRPTPDSLWKAGAGMTLSFDGAKTMKEVPCPTTK